MNRSKTDALHARSVVQISCLVALFCALPGTLTAQSLPSPWAAIDIGTPAVQGSATFGGGTFSINAAAGDGSAVEEPFTFVYQRLSGDRTIVARLRAFQTANPRARVGLMLRDSLDAASVHAFAFVSADARFGFERRAAAGGVRVEAGSRSGASVWLKLERRGSMITAFGSADAIAWSRLGTEIIPMQSSIYVGLAASGGDSALSTTADFSAVSVTAPPVQGSTARTKSTSASDLVQTNAAPAGWSSADIGLPLVAGSEQENAGVFTVTGGGTDIGGIADQFHYLYKQFTGDIDVIARVNSV